MARYSQAVVFESSRRTSRELYAAVDTQRGHLTSEHAQNTLFASLIREKNLQKTTSNSQVAHTPATLRAHLAVQMRYRRDKENSINDFWRLGSSFFTAKHLGTIGFSPGQSSTNSGSSESVAAQPGKAGSTRGDNPVAETPSPSGQDGAESIQSKRKRGDQELLEDSARPVKVPRVHHESDKAQAATAPSSRKRSSADAGIQDDAYSASKRSRTSSIGSLHDSVPAQASLTSPLPRETTNVPSEDSGATAHYQEQQKTLKSSCGQAGGSIDQRPIPDSQSQLASQTTVPTAKEVVPATQHNGDEQSEQGTSAAIDPAADSRRPNIDDYYAGRVKAPMKGLRAQHAAKLAQSRDAIAKANDELYPPELPDTGPNKMWNILIEQQDINIRIRNAMETLFLHSQSFLANFCGEELDSDGQAQFVQRPSQELQALYQKVLGSEHWNTKLLERANHAQPWVYDATHIMTSLIAAGIHEKVFCVEQPWNIAKRLQKHFSEEVQFFESAMDDRGYPFDEFLKHCSYKMVNSKKFQETTMKDHAKFLAAEFALIISPHLRLIRRSQYPDEERPDIAAGNDMQWVEYLEHLFAQALILKSKIDSYPEAQYTFPWPAVDTTMDRDTQMALSGKQSPNQKIMLTLWPGATSTTVPKHDQESRISHPARARVSTRPA